MAVNKTVAASDKLQASIPETASTAGELKATVPVTDTALEAVAQTASQADAVRKRKVDGLTKAREAKAAKALANSLAKEQTKSAQESDNRTSTVANARALAAEAALAKELARKEALSSISGIQEALASEKANDRMSFGDIREVSRSVPTAEEYVKVEIPLADLFDHAHPGVQLNRHRFEPGKTYLLRGDVALEVKRRLAMFHDEQVRLLRPNADRKALSDVNRGSQWTSRGSNVVSLGRLEDIPVASDERIYTVDF